MWCIHPSKVEDKGIGPPPKRGSTNAEYRDCLRKWGILVLFGLALVFIGGILGGLVVMLLSEHDNTISEPTSADAVVPSGAPVVPSGAPVVPSGVPVVPSVTPALGDRLLDELIYWNAISDDELLLLQFNTSAQYQALTWLRDDPIATSPARSPQDLLQRYVLAVLFFATSGEDWHQSYNFLSGDDVCSWNNGWGDDGKQGVYCRGDPGHIHFLTVNLSKNNLQGSLPWELVLLTNLQEINLDSNLLSGSIPTRINELTYLQYFYASYNFFTGALPTSFPSGIKNIFLIQNQIGGTIPEGYGTNMLYLDNLSLRENLLTGPLPTTLGNLANLLSLELSSNKFNGTIPSEYAQLRALERLSLQSNKLTGTIPSELGQLSSLISFWVDWNELTGPIPSELGKLPSLQDLGMYNNRLSGTIPTELGELHELVGLFLGSNRFIGSIPSELGNLSLLKSLWVNGNRLTGTIPAELARLSSLESFDFSKNPLKGSLDIWLCADDRSWGWLGADCEQVNCTCCTYCCQDNPPTCYHTPVDQDQG